MNKLILCFLCLLTLPLYAQDEAPLELEEDGMVSNPTENPDKPVDISDTNTEEEFVPTEEFKKEETGTAEVLQEPVEEIIAPAKPAVTSKPDLYLEKEMNEGKRQFEQRESHWLTTFGFENSKYEVIPDDFEFNGKKDFKNGTQELWGGRLGFGGEIYLGAGFLTRSTIEGYYMGTLFSRVLNGGDVAEDEKFAYTKRTGQILGFDAAQSFGWMFDFKTKNPFMDEWAYLTIETFVEAGIGLAYAYNNINYSYDLDVTQERYKLRVRDDLLNARVGAGFNLTSNAGYFLSLKATVNRYEVTKRKIDGIFQEDNTGGTVIDESPKNVNIDPILIFHLGGGYKF